LLSLLCCAFGWCLFSCGRAGAAGVLVRIVVSRSLPKLWWCSDQFLTGYSRDHDWTRCDRCYPLSCGPPVDMISESRDDHPNRSTGRHAEWAGRQTGRWVGTGLAGWQAALSFLCHHSIFLSRLNTATVPLRYRHQHRHTALLAAGASVSHVT
jgi:hypothetical protein